MHQTDVAFVEQSGRSALPGMIWIPGGTFRMGKHYREEAPVHRVTVSGFWIDCTPATNRQFSEFVRASGHVTFAEISPDPKNYPGALPDVLFAGSLVLTPPGHPGNGRPIGDPPSTNPTRRRRAAFQKTRAAARKKQATILASRKLNSLQGHQRRLASVRAELLPSLPPGRAPRGAGGYVLESPWLSLCRQIR